MRAKLLSLFALFATTGTILLINSASSAPGGKANTKPPVEWNPSAVNLIVSRNGHSEIPVTLTALTALGNITLEPVPALTPHVRITPSTLNNVKAGDSIPLRVSFTANASLPSDFFSGTILVREQMSRKGRGKVFPHPLSVRILIQGEEGLAGSDSDGNGVWDYIDHYINAKYSGAENESLRAASRQFARAIEGGLLNATNKQASLQFASASQRATECAFCVRPNDADKILADLEAAILNTKTRSRTFLMFSEQSAGQVFPSTPFSKRCNSCTSE